MPIQEQVLGPGELWEFTLKRGTTFQQQVTAEGVDLRLWDLFVPVYRLGEPASDFVLSVGSGIALDGVDHAKATFTISSTQTASLEAARCYRIEMFARLKTDPLTVMSIIDNGRFGVIDSSPELV